MEFSSDFEIVFQTKGFSWGFIIELVQNICNLCNVGGTISKKLIGMKLGFWVHAKENLYIS